MRKHRMGWGLCFLVLNGVVANAWGVAAVAESWEEIPVSGVLIVESGYDDNDLVGLVTDGALPSGCHSIGPVRITAGSRPRSFRVRQMAYRDRTGFCSSESSIPVPLKRPIPFSSEASLGQLPEGEYELEYLARQGNAVARRKFRVAKAASRSVDELPYALVTGVEMPDYVRTGEQVVPVLTGILTSSCARLEERVGILDEGDVLVLLPTQSFDESAEGCLDRITPFRLPVKLGSRSPGRYLIHARSMNGRAMNKVFGVYDDR